MDRLIPLDVFFFFRCLIKVVIPQKPCCLRANWPVVMVFYADFRPCQSLATEDPENRKPNRRGESRYTFSSEVKQTDKI